MSDTFNVGDIVTYRRGFSGRPYHGTVLENPSTHPEDGPDMLLVEHEGTRHGHHVPYECVTEINGAALDRCEFCLGRILPWLKHGDDGQGAKVHAPGTCR